MLAAYDEMHQAADAPVSASITSADPFLAVLSAEAHREVLVEEFTRLGEIGFAQTCRVLDRGQIGDGAFVGGLGMFGDLSLVQQQSTTICSHSRWTDERGPVRTSRIAARRSSSTHWFEAADRCARRPGVGRSSLDPIPVRHLKLEGNRDRPRTGARRLRRG
jgi:hypothetical protein